MPVKFYLQPNPITPDPNVQVAMVSTNIASGLVTGGYQIEVRTGYGKAASIRTGVLHKQLQII